MAVVPSSNAHRDSESGEARESAESGLRDARALLHAAPRDRRFAAAKLHDILATMRKEGRLVSLRDLELEEGPFQELLQDGHGIVRSVAIAVAGYTGNPRWIPVLMKYVTEDSDQFVRTRAVEALGRFEVTLLVARTDPYR